MYFYVLNIFGDVCIILDTNGNVCGSYLYDAYGNTATYTYNAEGKRTQKIVIESATAEEVVCYPAN